MLLNDFALDETAAPDDAWRVTRVRAGLRLPRGVLSFSEFRVRDGARRLLEMPATGVSVVIALDGTLQVDGGTFDTLVTGPSRRARTVWHDGGLHGIDIVLEPWLAWRVFGVPVSDLAGRAMALSDPLAREAASVQERLAAARDTRERIEVLYATLLGRRRSGPPPAPQVLAAWRLLVATHGRSTVPMLLAETGWSRRTLEQRFAQSIGLTPKAAGRVLRLRRAVHLISAGVPPSDVASGCGFADQPHLSREVKAMTGLPPSGLLALERSPCGLPRLDRIRGHRSSFFLPG